MRSSQVRTLLIPPGSPWENGYEESFNGKLRDKCPSRELFYALQEAQIPIEHRRRFYDTERPHSSLGYRPAAPEAVFSAKPTLGWVLTPSRNQAASVAGP